MKKIIVQLKSTIISFSKRHKKSTDLKKQADEHHDRYVSGYMDKPVEIGKAIEEQIRKDFQLQDANDETGFAVPDSGRDSIVAEEHLVLEQDVPPQDDLAAESKMDRIPEETAEIAADLSALQNGPYIKVVAECADIMNEIEQLAQRMETPFEKQLLTDIVTMLQHALERAGVERIADESSFNILRHTPLPMKRVPDGAPIEETIIHGLCIGNRVFRKAKVKVKV